MTRKVDVADLKTNREFTFIEVSIRHAEGGLNYLDYTETKRGYYCHVAPVEIKDGFRTSRMGSGYKFLIEESARMSKPKMEKLGKTIMETDKFKKVLARLLEEQKLELTPAS